MNGRIDQITQWMDLFLAKDQIVEMRVILQEKGKAYQKFCMGAETLAQLAVEGDNPQALGVYFTPNPLRSEMLKSRKSARATDVLSRRWLLIDCDPHRKAGLSSTEEERAASYELLLLVQGTMEAAGASVNPVIADSGNGFHICYPIDLPNDQVTHGLIKSVLKGLSGRLSDERAKVDTATHDAPRIWKLYGTQSRKGEPTDDRPHRFSRVLSGTRWTEDAAQQNNLVLPRLLEIHQFVEAKRSNRPADPLTEQERYAKAALLKETDAVANASQGNRNNQLNTSAYNLSQLIGAGTLQYGDVYQALFASAKQCGLEDGEIVSTLRSGLGAGIKQPRDMSTIGSGSNGKHTPSITADDLDPKKAKEEDDEPITLENIATIDDLIEAGSSFEYLWEYWIQRGVVTAIAAPGGTGKTRFVADLLRRIAYCQPWPDGTPMTLPSDTQSLWVLSDNHHDEMVRLATGFGIKPNVKINASKKKPWDGVILDSLKEYRQLAKRVELLRPDLVIVDTVGNSTAKNLSKQEDAKEYYFPLQVIARKFRCAVICMTHLNATGDFLGRRVKEKVRIAIRISKPNAGDDRRRVEVDKTNDKYPPALGMTIGDCGNEFDTNPPQVEDIFGPKKRRGPMPRKTLEAIDFLREELSSGPKRVSKLITEAQLKGISKATLYNAKDDLGLDDFEDKDNKKWWQLDSLNNDQSECQSYIG